MVKKDTKKSIFKMDFECEKSILRISLPEISIVLLSSLKCSWGTQKRQIYTSLLKVQITERPNLILKLFDWSIIISD